MSRIKFVSVFVLVALLLSVMPGATLAKEPPPEPQTPDRFIPVVGESFTPLRGCSANTPPASPFPSPTLTPPVPDSYEHCDWVWVVDECFPGYFNPGYGGCRTLCDLISGGPAQTACYAGCWLTFSSYCTGHWEWFCA